MTPKLEERIRQLSDLIGAPFAPLLAAAMVGYCEALTDEATEAIKRANEGLKLAESKGRAL